MGAGPSNCGAGPSATAQLALMVTWSALLVALRVSTCCRAPCFHRKEYPCSCVWYRVSSLTWAEIDHPFCRARKNVFPSTSTLSISPPRSRIFTYLATSLR